jgi:biotin synthase-related radical SAM superfamily protein
MVQEAKIDLELARKKAELISVGCIYIPTEIKVPFPMSRSTAGPGAGTPGLVFSLENKMRAKLGVVKDKITKFELREVANDNTNKYQIYKDGELFIDNVQIVPTLLHAPSQAFINIASNCIFDCKFCASPHLDPNDIKKPQYTNQDWADLIIKTSKNNNFESVALTSAVPASPEQTVDDMLEIITKVKTALGEAVPIGVEPYVTELQELDRLHDVGATELKLNIQSYDRNIFELICPGLDFEKILKCIEYGVKVFGRNNVCSNLIIGLGETDEKVIAGIEHLAKMGAVVNLRALRTNDYNIPNLTEAIGHKPEPISPDRIFKLAHAQKEIFEKYNLTTTSFKTMCHKCKCCDLVPEHDI